MATRRERVVLDLTDNLTPGLARAAGAAMALDKALGGVDGQQVKVGRVMDTTTPKVERFGASTRRAGADIDSFSGRVSLLVDLLLTLGPAAIPMGAVLIPALTTLVGLGASVAAGAGSMAVAFQGVGEALKKVNEHHLDPTKENLEEMREAMKRLAPAAQDFVRQIDSMRGLGASIRDAGAEALFPGLVDALDTLESRGPDVIRIVEAFNAEIGEIASESADSLASERWDDFFRMVEREGPRTLDPLARAIGDIAHGATEIMEAFAPLNRDGMGWLADGANDFDKWARGLKKTDGFKDFVAYVRDSGPEVAETMGALATAFVDIAQAAAPLGGPALDAIEGIAKAASAVASSDFGTELMTAAIAMRIMARVGPGVALAAGAVGAAGKGGGKTGLLAAGAGGAAAGAGAGKFAGKFPKIGGPQMAAGALGIGIVDTLANNNSILDWVARQGAAAGKATGAEDFFPWIKDKIEVELGIKVEKKGAENTFSWVRAEMRRLNRETAKPKVDIDDKNAKVKQRQADDWIHQWGKKNASAQARVEDKQRRKASADADKWLNVWGGSSGAADVKANDQASPTINRVSGLLAGLDGRNATTTITTVYRTRRINEGTGAGYGASDFGVASGGTVPDDGGGYRDYLPAVLAPREEVISNRYGQADRWRPLLKAINANRLADGGTVKAISAAMRGGGGSFSRASSTAPSVTVGAPGVRVFIDGREVRALVRSEIAADNRWEREQARD